MSFLMLVNDKMLLCLGELVVLKYSFFGVVICYILDGEELDSFEVIIYQDFMLIDGIIIL